MLLQTKVLLEACEEFVKQAPECRQILQEFAKQKKPRIEKRFLLGNICCDPVVRARVCYAAPKHCLLAVQHDCFSRGRAEIDADEGLHAADLSSGRSFFCSII